MTFTLWQGKLVYMNKALRIPDDDDQFELPPAIILGSLRLTREGVRTKVTPLELAEQMVLADRALNGDSNDAEHDALYEIREWLSQVYEDPRRRTS